MAKFKPGQSGNPSGRPRGITDSRTELRGLLTPHAAELVSRCVNLAKAGDPVALRICMDRLVSPVREEPVKFALPPIAVAVDCIAAQSAVVAAAAAGAITPSQAQVLSNLVDGLRKSFETTVLQDMARRLEALEAMQRARAPAPARPTNP